MSSSLKFRNQIDTYIHIYIYIYIKTVIPLCLLPLEFTLYIHIVCVCVCVCVWKKICAWISSSDHPAVKSSKSHHLKILTTLSLRMKENFTEFSSFLFFIFLRFSIWCWTWRASGWFLCKTFDLRSYCLCKDLIIIMWFLKKVLRVALK